MPPSPARPERVVVVAGTGTGVGKTWTAAAMVRLLVAAGRAVAVRKPVQSYAPEEAASGKTDAHVLGAAAGEPPESVCPPARWYPLGMAPPMAAEALGRAAFSVDDLAGELDWPAGTEVGLVEGAGGVRSPLAGDGDTVALAAALGADAVLLVAEAGLGTINAVRLAAGALAGREVVVLLNRFDAASDLHRRNRAWLAERDGLAVAASVAEAAAVLGLVEARGRAALAREAVRPWHGNAPGPTLGA